MHPDPEILEVEQRLARRRLEIELLARESGRRAMKGLTSPAVMIGVVALGFLAGAGVSRRPARASADKGSAAKKTGFTGLLMTGAMWLLKQQLGNPAQIAQLIMSKVEAARMKKYRASPPYQSPHGDTPLYR